MNQYLVYGLGLPIFVEAVSPEVAEAIVIQSVVPRPDVSLLLTRRVYEVPCA